MILCFNKTCNNINKKVHNTEIQIKLEYICLIISWGTLNGKEWQDDKGVWIRVY